MANRGAGGFDELYGPDDEYAMRQDRIYRAPARPRARAMATTAALVGLSCAVAGQLFYVMPHVQTQLKSETEAALKSGGLAHVGVSVEGRDIVVSGVRSDEATSVANLVQQVPGSYRVVRIEVGDGQAAATDPGPPVVLESAIGGSSVPGASAIDLNDVKASDLANVAITLDRGRVEVFGTVPDANSEERLLSALRRGFGPEEVRSFLVLDPTAGSIGLEGLPDVVRALGPQTRAGVVALRAGRLTITGTTAREVSGEISRFAPAVVGTDPQALQLDLMVSADAANAPANDEDIARMLSGLPPIRFSSGSAQISEVSDPVIHLVAELLIAHPAVNVEIAGHTDSSGSAESNRKLSTERAQAVREELQRSGVAWEQLTAEGYGDSQPLVAGTSELANELNRRVVFVAETP